MTRSDTTGNWTGRGLHVPARVQPELKFLRAGQVADEFEREVLGFEQGRFELQSVPQRIEPL
jgi:hypothetical protein